MTQQTHVFRSWQRNINCIIFQLSREALSIKSRPIHCNIALGGRLGYVCTLSLLLFVSTARCQAAPSQNLGCSISFALAQDRSLVHPSPRHPIRPAVLRGRRASEDVQRSCVFFGHRHHPASSHCTLIDLIGNIRLSLTRSRIASTESETAFLSPLRIPNNLQTSLRAARLQLQLCLFLHPSFSLSRSTPRIS